jgi:LPXTG-motif cell wall-anchored protein
MFGLKDISVSFLTGHPVWVILGGLVLLGLAGLLYWKTNPPLPLWLRIVLGTLRVVAVLALIIALAPL